MMKKKNADVRNQALRGKDFLSLRFYCCVVKSAVFAVFIASVMLLFAGCQDERPPNTVNSLEDVPGKYIGAMSGTPSARLADELGVARSFFSGDELIRGLTSGMVDCAVLESVMADELVSGASGVRILGETLLEYDLRFAIPRENAELLNYVNAALAALNANGTLRNLRDKYFSGKRYEYSPPADVEARPGFLRLAIPADTPPYSFKDEDGEYTGLDVEVARAVCDYLGVQLQIIEVDARELVTAVWFGRADLAAGWLPGDIEDQVVTSDDYANTSYVVLVRR